MQDRKTILITGVAGLLGSRMLEWILENKPEYRVIGIDNFSGGYEFNVPDANARFTFIEDNLYSLNNLKFIFDTYKPEYVYHFAAYAAEGLSPFIRSYNYINNVIATSNITTCCIQYKVKRLVFTSSMAVYGEQDPPFDESLPRSPIDPYGIAKSACEQDIEVAGKQHDLDYCIIRPHNVYGRNQNISDTYRNVLGIWMYKILNGEKLSVYGDGKQTRAFSCIDDILEPLWNAATLPEASREIINLGGIETSSIIAAAKTLIEVAGKGEIEYLPPRHEAKHAFPTYQKSVDILKFKHTTSLRDGLEDMWMWASGLHRVPKRLIWGSYELEEGIYPYWETDKLIESGEYRVISPFRVRVIGDGSSDDRQED